MSVQTDRFCGAKLRTLCMVIGYLHLASSIADITYHFLTVAIVTNGLQCDPSIDSLKAVTNIPYLDSFLMILNIGTHGFYPFPRLATNQYNIYVEFMAVTSMPRCYPGMLHVYLVDVLNFFINIIWLRIVISYIGGLHKRNPDPMQMFFTLSIVKLVMQLLYFGYQPDFSNTYDYDTYWSLKILDISIAVFLLIIVRKYTLLLKAEKSSQNVEKPPPYVECLMGTFDGPNRPLEQKEAIIDLQEEKKEENKQAV